MPNFLGQSFTVNPVVGKVFEGPIALRVAKDQHKIVFKSKSDYLTPTLGYIASTEVLSSKNLSILDKSDSVEENRFLTDSSFTLFENILWKTGTKEFFLTDTFVDSDAKFPTQPLFYVHSLSKFLTGTTVLSAYLLDKNLKKVTIEDSVIDLPNGKIYSNLENSLDEADGILTLYYVQYTIKSGANTNTYTELLSNKPAFHLADFADIDPDTGNLLASSGAYFLEEVGDSEYQITLPVPKLYGIREVLGSKIRLEDPPEEDLDNPWFISITNGKFTRNGRVYSIPEFSTQVFNPVSPTKFTQWDIAEWVNPNLIKLTYGDIKHDDDLALHLTIRVYDKSEWDQWDDLDPDGPTPKKVFTTDSDLIGDTISEGLKYEDGIRSIDSLSGFVDLSIKVRDDEVVACDYYHDEKKLEFVDLDFNPLFNSSSLKKRHVFFLIPDSDTTAVYYLTVNGTGKITSTSLTSPPFAIDGTVSLATFETTYTTSGGNDYQYFILGDVIVDDATSEQELSTLDLRVLGGGLRETHTDLAAQENPQALSYWDAGTPYPGMSSYLVQIPRTTLSDHGGSLSKDEVRSFVSRHTALGSYPVIRFYGQDPKITDLFALGSNQVKLNWTTVDSDLDFSVFQSDDKDTWTEITTGVTTNTYTVTSGLSTAYYWFKVEAVNIATDVVKGISEPCRVYAKA